MANEKKNVRGCVWGCARWGILFLVIFAVCVWRLLFVSVPLEISPETTIVTEPRTADGKEVDFWAHIQSQFPKDIATDRNAARRLVRIFGSFDSMQAGEPTPERDALVFEKLGLENVEPQLTFQDVVLAHRDYLNKKYPDRETSEEQERLFTEEYEAGDIADLSSPIYEEAFRRAWLEANTPALDAFIREMDAGDFFFYPLIRMEDEKSLQSILLPHAQQMRDFAWAFRFRIQCRLLDGDIDGAIEDRNAGIRIARKVQKPLFTMIELLCARNCELIILGTQIKLAPEEMLTAEQVQKLQEIPWDTERKMRKNEILENEFCMAFDFLQKLSRGKATPEDIRFVLGDDEIDPVQSFIFLKLGYDWNEVSRAFQKFCRDGLNVEGNPELEKFLHENFLFQILWPRERSRLLASVLCCSYLVGNGRAQIALEEISESLAHIGYAMELYRLEHEGKLPPAFTRDAEGKPLHSWRVLILPYLGEREKALYEKIRLDEPWDSEWNRQFHAQMPVFYRSGAIRHWRTPDPDPVTETRLTVLLGDEGLFNDSGTGVDPVQFVKKDPERQLGKMALVLDRCEAVCWMKPDTELRSEDLIRDSEMCLESEVLVLSPTLAVHRLSPNEIAYAPENDVMLWTAGKPAPAPETAEQTEPKDPADP